MYHSKGGYFGYYPISAQHLTAAGLSAATAGLPYATAGAPNAVAATAAVQAGAPQAGQADARIQ